MKMRFHSVLAAAVVLALPGASEAQGTSTVHGTQAAEDTVIATVHRLFEGMRTADSALVRSVFAGGARFASVDTRATPPTVKYDSVDGWIIAIAGSNGRWDEQIYDVTARVDGGIAHVWAPYTFYLDKAVLHCGINTIELLRLGDAWKITQISDTRRRASCRDPLKQ